MSERAKALAERLRAFNIEVMEFVRNCSDRDWKKVCPSEEWTVGVTARHIGAAHFNAVELVRKVVKGEELPQMSMEQIVDMANQHAREHADCTREEVLDVLRRTGDALAEFTATLSDEDLDRKGLFAATGREFTAEKLIKAVILDSGGGHFASIKAASAS